MLHTHSVFSFQLPLKVVAIHPTLCLHPPLDAVAHAARSEAARVPAEYMRQRPTREIRDDPISKGNTPSRKKSQIRWKATPFQVYTLSVLCYYYYSVCVCIQCVCVCVSVHLMKDRARSSREPEEFIQYDGGLGHIHGSLYKDIWHVSHHLTPREFFKVCRARHCKFTDSFPFAKIQYPMHSFGLYFFSSRQTSGN